jgi:hypothetical protein
MGFVGLLLLLLALACQPKPSVRLTQVPDLSPRTPQDTFGRLEFVIRTLNGKGCDDCAVWLRWPGARSGDTNASGARRTSQGTLGALGPGPYELRVEGPGLVPLVRQIDLPPRHTLHADIRMVPVAR